MTELKKCCKVPFPEKIFEQYEVGDQTITANVGTGKVADMMRHFIEMRDEPVFFILELPTDLGNEEKFSDGIADGFHTDVYYLDNCSQEAALSLLNSLAPLLIDDGMNAFGFGGHASNDEIMFGKYNVMTVYAADIAKYEKLFTDLGIEKTAALVTAWDTFDSTHPGESFRYEKDGRSVYNIPGLLRDSGLYLAERRGEQRISLDEMVGKLALVGLTFYSGNEIVDRKQFWGRVVSADAHGILIEHPDGKRFNLPPDTTPVSYAAPGNYTLHSTGETVTDPDYLITWNINKDGDSEDE